MTKQQAQEPEIVTLEQALEILHWSEATLRRRMRDGIIAPLPRTPGLKKHYRLLFRRADVEALLKQ